MTKEDRSAGRALERLEILRERSRNAKLREIAEKQISLVKNGVTPPRIRSYISSALLIADKALAGRWNKMGWQFAKEPNNWHWSTVASEWLREAEDIKVVELHAVTIVPHSHLSSVRVFKFDDLESAIRDEPRPRESRLSLRRLTATEREVFDDFLERTCIAEWLEGADEILARPADYIEMKCAECGHLLSIAKKYAGREGVCRYCNSRFKVEAAT